MRDRVNFLAMKQITHRRVFAKIDVAHGRVFRKTGNVRALDLWIVKIIEVVNDDDSIPGRQQLLDKVRPDETGAACDQNSHVAKLATDAHRWTQIFGTHVRQHRCSRGR
jgi:hypothetical protein